jgi:hypothetical protein
MCMCVRARFALLCTPESQGREKGGGGGGGRGEEGRGGGEEGGTPQMGCHLDKAMISPIVIFGSQQAPKWLQVGSKLAPRGRSNWVIQTPEFDVKYWPE